ncbi:Uncharacterised protein [Mycobacteroides abscessus]|nr:Uncharacterised protein [Mycobacteroides abscessus]
MSAPVTLTTTRPGTSSGVAPGRGARSTAKTLANTPPLSGSDRSASPSGATSAASWSSVTVVLVSTRRCYRPGRRRRTRARAGHRRRVRTP